MAHDPDPDPTRQYSDREVRLILKSAVEMQERRADREDVMSTGMSLVELERAAVEAGLDPSLVRKAAAQLDAPRTPSGGNAFLGAPDAILVERVVDVAIDPRRFDAVLDVVRAVTHGVGELSSVGRQFGWKGRLDGAKTEVNVSAGEHRTTLRVRVALEEVALGHFMLKGTLFGAGGGLIGAGLATAALGPIGLAIGAVTLGSGYLWSRESFRRSAARYNARANELLRALAARVAEIAHETTPR